MEVFFWNSKLIFIDKIINAFDHLEFCLVLNLTLCCNLDVTWPLKIATRYVSFATTLNTR